MTVTDIKNGIAETLKAEYTDFDIYTEHLKQGFNDRCFFIERISAQKLNKVCLEDFERYEYTHNFAVTCFCDDSKERLDEIADSLYHTLSNVVAGGNSLYGMGMSHSYSDGALIFLVDYVAEVNVQGDTIPEMEVLSVNGKTE